MKFRNYILLNGYTEGVKFTDGIAITTDEDEIAALQASGICVEVTLEEDERALEAQDAALEAVIVPLDEASTEIEEQLEVMYVSEYTNAASSAAIKTLLDAATNELGLTVTAYKALSTSGKKTTVCDGLFVAKETLTSKAAIQSALDAEVTAHA